MLETCKRFVVLVEWLRSKEISLPFYSDDVLSDAEAAIAKAEGR